MKVFTIGDHVEVLDEAIQGKVIAVDGALVTLQTEEGFPMQFASSQLVKTGDAIQVTNYEAFQVKKEKETPKKKPPVARRPKERNTPKLEVDLSLSHSPNPVFHGVLHQIQTRTLYTPP